MTDDPNPATDTRQIVWLAVKPNGCPEMGTAKSPEGIPPRAGWYCREGDREWTRVNTG